MKYKKTTTTTETNTEADDVGHYSERNNNGLVIALKL